MHDGCFFARSPAFSLSSHRRDNRSKEYTSRFSARLLVSRCASRGLAKKLVKLGEYKQLLSLVHHAWLQAETRENAIELLSSAAGFIPLKPELGIAFCDAFTWVNDFLKG
jgi:hypothetical protein